MTQHAFTIDFVASMGLVAVLSGLLWPHLYTTNVVCFRTIYTPPMSAEHERPSELKVFGVGLSRTGTKTLASALEKLGFAPCYHPFNAGYAGSNWHLFAKAAKDGASREEIEELYRGYKSAVDWPTAIIAKSLYDAYPDAKYILSVRDPARWTESMRKTIFKRVSEPYYVQKARFADGTAMEADYASHQRAKQTGWADWVEVLHEHYHRGVLLTDPEGENIRHEEYIKQLIPEDKLLVFNMAEGWAPLTKFLGVPTPDESFPWINDSDDFQTGAKQWEESMRK